MALTKEQLIAREGKITASFAPVLMSGDEAKILNEWKLLVGDPTWEPWGNMEYDWLPSFGAYVEKFIIDWHERKTKDPLTCRGDVVVHPEMPHIACTLDAFRKSENRVVDCKNFHSYRRLDDALPYYVPQLIVQKACKKATAASLLFSHGGMEPKEQDMQWPVDYEEKVWRRIDQFWQCVVSMTPPVAMPDESAPPPPNKRKSYSFEGNNKWADLAATWLENHEAGKKADDAKDALKKLMPRDASDATGHGVVITRSEGNKLFVKKVKEDGKKSK